ncbi:hypothetical protein [Paraglaciecola aestuariivivens]
MKQKLAQSQLVKEYQANKRLQWMVVGIGVILLLSFLKQISVVLSDKQAEIQTQLKHFAKLKSVANQTFDSNLMQSIQAQVDSTLDNFMSVASSSTAEAQGLQDIDNKIGKYVKRKRLNLIGSEQVLAGNQEMWSVRIEIAGQVSEQDFVKILSHFDASQTTTRIASMQYSPKTSDSFSLVTDLIYKRGNHG